MSDIINVTYQGQLRCEAKRLEKNQFVHTDVGLEHGGLGEHYSPVELVVAALGTCITSMMAVVADRNQVNLTGMQIHAAMEMVSVPARRIGAVRLTVLVPNSASISSEVRQKLEAAAGACPVKNSLHPDIKITMTFLYE
jgi:uncharacterized OsmC-like protein